MVAASRLLPPNATPLERALVDVAPRPLLDELADAPGTLKSNPPAVVLPWLAAQYRLAEFAGFFPDTQSLLDAGLPWLKVRGTAAAVKQALSWIGMQGLLEEDGALLQIDPGSPEAPANLAAILQLVAASVPAHVRLYRLYHGYDVRMAIASGGSRFSECLWSDDSGVWAGGVKLSFGRRREALVVAQRIPPASSRRRVFSGYAIYPDVLRFGVGEFGEAPLLNEPVFRSRSYTFGNSQGLCDRQTASGRIAHAKASVMASAWSVWGDLNTRFGASYESAENVFYWSDDACRLSDFDPGHVVTLLDEVFYLERHSRTAPVHWPAPKPATAKRRRSAYAANSAGTNFGTAQFGDEPLLNYPLSQARRHSLATNPEGLRDPAYLVAGRSIYWDETTWDSRVWWNEPAYSPIQRVAKASLFPGLSVYGDLNARFGASSESAEHVFYWSDSDCRLSDFDPGHTVAPLDEVFYAERHSQTAPIHWPQQTAACGQRRHTALVIQPADFCFGATDFGDAPAINAPVSGKRHHSAVTEGNLAPALPAFEVLRHAKASIVLSGGGKFGDLNARFGACSETVENVFYWSDSECRLSDFDPGHVVAPVDEVFEKTHDSLAVLGTGVAEYVYSDAVIPIVESGSVLSFRGAKDDTLQLSIPAHATHETTILKNGVLNIWFFELGGVYRHVVFQFFKRDVMPCRPFLLLSVIAQPDTVIRKANSSLATYTGAPLFGEYCFGDVFDAVNPTSITRTHTGYSEGLPDYKSSYTWEDPGTWDSRMSIGNIIFTHTTTQAM